LWYGIGLLLISLFALPGRVRSRDLDAELAALETEHRRPRGNRRQRRCGGPPGPRAAGGGAMRPARSCTANIQEAIRLSLFLSMADPGSTLTGRLNVTNPRRSAAGRPNKGE
jgi:hypothetical protein